MKKKIMLILLLTIVISIFGQVNGFITDVNGKTVMKLWGTHQERGYAHGYLVAEKFLQVFDNYVIGTMLMGQSQYYNGMRSYFEANFVCDSLYVTEAMAIVTGIQDAGASVHSTYLNRDIDYIDVLICNTIPDLSTTFNRYCDPEHTGGCSSLTSWGNATQNDNLNGELVITRYLDWSVSSHLSSNSMIIVHEPSEVDEQPWFSFGFPGMFGALSAINESGVAVFQNMGNDNTRVPGHTYSPILLTLRKAVESRDCNDDNVSNIDDVRQALTDDNCAFGAIVQSVTHMAEYEFATVFEINDNLGLTSRNVTDNTAIAGDNLAATNHFRELISPSACSRYSALSSSIEDTTNVTLQKSLSLMYHACGVMHNLHVIQYVPSSGYIRWAVAGVAPAYQSPSTELNRDDLLSLTVGISEDVVQYDNSMDIYPNPFNPETTIKFDLTEAAEGEFCVYNVKGQKIRTIKEGTFRKGTNILKWNGINENGINVSSGVYLMVLKTGNYSLSSKAVLIK